MANVLSMTKILSLCGVFSFVLLVGSAATSRGEPQHISWAQDRHRLEQRLPLGETREFYRERLQSFGYQITAVTADEPEHVAYEIVRGKRIYAVEMTMNPRTKRAVAVNVSRNLWPSEAAARLLVQENWLE